MQPHAKPNSRQQRHIAPCVSWTALLSSPLSPSSGPERLSACASAYEYACVNSNRGVGVWETPMSVASQHVLMRGDTGILMYRKACGRASTKTQHHLVVSKGVSSGEHQGVLRASNTPTCYHNPKASNHPANKTHIRWGVFTHKFTGEATQQHIACTAVPPTTKLMPHFFPAPLLPSRPYCTLVQPATSQFPQSEWDRLPRLAALCGDRRGASIQSPTAALNHRSGPEVRGRAQSALADKSVAVHQNATHTSMGSIKMVYVCMRGGVCD